MSLTPILYRVRDMQGFDTVTIDTLGGVDLVEVTGRDDGSLAVNVQGGDVLELPGTANDTDMFIVSPATVSDAGTACVDQHGCGLDHDPIRRDHQDRGGRRRWHEHDLLTLMGTGDDNAFTLVGTGTLAGDAQVDAGPIVSFFGLGSDGSGLVLDGQGGDDVFAVTSRQ